MARRTQTYAIRLAVEGGGQVKAELVSVGQSGEQSLKRIESAGDKRVGRAQGTGPPGGAAAHRHPHAGRRAVGVATVGGLGGADRSLDLCGRCDRQDRRQDRGRRGGRQRGPPGARRHSVQHHAPRVAERIIAGALSPPSAEIEALRAEDTCRNARRVEQLTRVDMAVRMRSSRSRRAEEVDVAEKVRARSQ